MRLESELGPLWTEEPKTTGFRLAIADPAQILAWQRQTAIQNGDLSLEQAGVEFEEAIRSGKTLPNTRAWEVNLESKLFSSLKLNIGGYYSPKSGEWGEVVACLNYSELAIIRNDYWRLSHSTEEICALIRQKGFPKAFTYEDDSKIQLIIVPNDRDTSRVIISLGFKTLEDAREADPENPEGTASSDVLIYLEESPLQLIPFLINLQHFQRVMSCSVDSLYEASNLAPPNVLLTLSSEQESE